MSDSAFLRTRFESWLSRRRTPLSPLLRDWSLIMGRGASEVLPLQKGGGGADKVLAMPKGGGHKKFCGSFNTGA